ncbi:MAG: hypothetical protein RLY93_02815 [Sumerlaeia bacterium]
MKRIRLQHREVARGYLLIEVALATLFISVALVALYRSLETSLEAHRAVEFQRYAQALADDRIARARADGSYREGQESGASGENDAWQWTVTTTALPVPRTFRLEIEIANASGDNYRRVVYLSQHAPQEGGGGI